MCFLFGSLTKAQNLKNTSPNPQKSPYSYRVCADALTAWMKDPARDAQTAWRDALDIPGEHAVNIVLRASWRNALPSLQSVTQRAAIQSLKRECELGRDVVFCSSFSSSSSKNLCNNKLSDFTLANLRQCSRA